jgi:hypothetical protein
VSGEQVRLRKLELHDQKDRVELGVVQWELGLYAPLPTAFTSLKGLSHLTHCFNVSHIHPDSVTYLDLQYGHASAIVVQLELILGFDEGGFGFRHSSSDPVAEFINGVLGRVHTIRLNTHLREVAGVHHK